jgi:hypothetical protein
MVRLAQGTASAVPKKAGADSRLKTLQSAEFTPLGQDRFTEGEGGFPADPVSWSVNPGDTMKALFTSES